MGRVALARAIVLGVYAVVLWNLFEDRSDDDEAIRRTTPLVEKAGVIHMIPSILAVRAISRAALGRADEARAELATILREHRDWANAAVTDFRVRLVLAVKRGDLDAARALAHGRTAALPLPMRDDVLCDLVLATSGDGFSSDDRERLAGELDDDVRLRAWVDAIAPGMRDRLATTRARIDVHEPAHAEAPEADPEGTEEEEESSDGDLRGLAKRTLPTPRA